MGRKRFGTGKQIYLCAAFLIFLSPLACSLSNTTTAKTSYSTGDEARAHLATGKALLAQGEYGNALNENEKALALAGRNGPADEALFYVGLIYAHPANKGRNYEKSLVSFRRLMQEYPASPLIEQAKTMADLLQENERLDRATDKLTKLIDEQKKTVEKLNNIIDELKQVDINVEQKKREQAK